MDSERKCTTCLEEKALAEFEKCPNRKDTWRHTCKKCRSARRRENLDHEQRMRMDSNGLKSAHEIWDNAIRKKGGA